MSHSWLDALGRAVVNAPENADQFGDPPKSPVAVMLPSGVVAFEPWP